MIDLDSFHDGEVPQNSSDSPDEDAFLQITVELTVDGKNVLRKFRARDVEHINWNPVINSMADTMTSQSFDEIWNKEKVA